MKYKKITALVLLCILLFSCGSTASTSSNSITSEPTSSELPASPTPSESSSSEQSEQPESSEVIPSVPEGTQYKTQEIYYTPTDYFTAEIPDYWIVKQQELYNTCLFPVREEDFTGEYQLYYYFEILDDKNYTDEYFTSGEADNDVLNTSTDIDIDVDNIALTTIPSVLQTAGPPINEPVFKLSDGTQVYFSSDGAAGSIYEEYDLIIDAKLVKMKFVYHNPVDDPDKVNRQASEEEIIHLLDTVKFS